jgi:hypothetical protein
MASKDGQKNLARSQFGECNLMKKYAQPFLIKRIQQS